MSSALAVDIVYPDDQGAWPLETDPLWGVEDSLFPGDSYTDNNVTVNFGSLIPGNVFGAVSNSDDEVSGNTVTVNDAAIGTDVYGGASSDGAATDNLLEVNGGTIGSDVYAGYSIFGAATSNNLMITGGFISSDAYGGYSIAGSATGNMVTMTGGTVMGDLTGGSASGFVGNSSGNIVNIVNGTVSTDVIGGWAYSGSANNNEVTISGGVIEDDAIGGYGVLGVVENNTLTISGGMVLDSAAAGVSDDTATVKGNKIIVNGGSIANLVSGGYSQDGVATGNTATINTGTFNGGVAGGSSITGNVADNTVNVVDGTFNADVSGGSSANGNAQGNLATISGGDFNANIYGGMSTTGSAANNVVNLNDGTFNGDVMGGYSQSGNATGNTVNYSNGTPNSDIIGGQSDNGSAQGNAVTIANNVANHNVYGGRSPLGLAAGNSVTINSGAVKEKTYGGFSTSGDATGNMVTLNSGNAVEEIIGGSTDSGAASSNSVNITNGTAHAQVYGGMSNTGAATGNTVSISGGTLNGDIVGGMSTDASATGNMINISGGTFNANIYGGMSTNADATGNTVTISGMPDLSMAQIMGGSAAGDAMTGNTLNIYSPGLTVDSLGGFEQATFYLPSTVVAGDTILSVTNDALLNGTTFTVNSQIAASPLDVGDTVNLIDAGNLDANATSAQGGYGSTLLYTYDLNKLGNMLQLQVASIGLDPKTKSLSEGFISGIGMITQGADLAANAGMTEATNASRSQGGAMSGFMAVSGGSMRYNTGSYVDVDGFSLMAGVSKAFDMDDEELSVGVFFEYGYGSYDTFNSVPGAPDVRGGGDSDYYGGGLLGRFDFEGHRTGHFYLEATARTGSISNDYSSNNLGSTPGITTSYNASSMYFGASVGGGFLWQPDKSLSFDFYARGLWARQQGSDVTLSTGERVNFADTNSLRTQVGTTVVFEVSEWVDGYGGLAWEYEFDGEANANTGGYSIVAPSLKGNTGIAEAGVSIKPTQHGDLSKMRILIGVQGYMGEREGVTGSGRISYGF